MIKHAEIVYVYIYICVCVFSLVAPTILEVLSGVVCVPGNAKLWGNQVLFLPGFMIFIYIIMRVCLKIEHPMPVQGSNRFKT